MYKKEKKKIFVVTFFIILIFIMFLIVKSNNNGYITEYVSEDMIIQNKHSQLLAKYNSPYTLCYKNEDNTYTFYIFSSPISYKVKNKYEFINNKIVNIKNKEMKDKGYLFENLKNNIKTYYSNNNRMAIVRNFELFSIEILDETINFSNCKIQSTGNMYGDESEALIYGDPEDDMYMKCYSTKAGVRTEIIFNKKPESNKLKFKVDFSGSKPVNKNNGYITFEDDNVKGIINSFSLKDNSDMFSLNNKINILNDELVELEIDNNLLNSSDAEYPLTIDTSFEMYLNKSPDSGIYSKRPDINSYLSSHAIIGNSEYSGIGREYIRFRLSYFLGLLQSDIISSDFFIKEFHRQGNGKLAMYKMDSEWSSTGVTWDCRVEPSKELISQGIESNGYIGFDITNFVKRCFMDGDWTTESNGLMLKNESEEFFDYSVLASSDNLLYPPYIRLTLKNEPYIFEAKENINEER